MRSIAITTQRAIEALDVTDLVTTLDWPDGFLLLSVPHTTAALILGENDPEMLEDYEKVATGLPAPFEPFKHHRNDNPNAAAHVISSFAGTQLILPVEDGSVVLGTWQRIIFIELDGPKSRTLLAGSLPNSPVPGGSH
jgi:secondary thiamine-phosphate synthase enzyme